MNHTQTAGLILLLVAMHMRYITDDVGWHVASAIAMLCACALLLGGAEAKK